MITDFLFLPGIAATIMEKLVLFLDIDVQLQIRTYQCQRYKVCFQHLSRAKVQAFALKRVIPIIPTIMVVSFS